MVVYEPVADCDAQPDSLESLSPPEQSALLTALLSKTADTSMLTGSALDNAGELLGFAIPAANVPLFPGME